jgi:hypothetical protein
MLRFEAFLESIWPSDKERRFVFTYYLADDTISIFEPIPPNAGRMGGRFLIRFVFLFVYMSVCMSVHMSVSFVFTYNLVVLADNTISIFEQVIANARRIRERFIIRFFCLYACLSMVCLC